MTEENNNPTTPLAEEPAVTPDKSGKSGLIKYAIFGVAGLVVVVAIAFGTLMLIGTGDSPQAESETAPMPEKSADAKVQPGQASNPKQAPEDSILAWLEEDESVLENIMKNLEVLQYEPTESELAGEESGLSVEDSIEAANWLEAEKKKLTERSRALDTREKELNVLDSRVSKKILVIEQAESTRISKLAKLYDGMDPRSVAKLLANLDDQTVVALIPRMKSKTASQVLALMPPVRAAKLSKQMITIAEN